jgi:hypothetical protein
LFTEEDGREISVCDRRRVSLTIREVVGFVVISVTGERQGCPKCPFDSEKLNDS